MKVKDLFPFWGTQRDPLMKPLRQIPELIIAQRPPSEADKVECPWWYDASSKTMYRGTKEGYVKD